MIRFVNDAASCPWPPSSSSTAAGDCVETDAEAFLGNSFPARYVSVIRKLHALLPALLHRRWLVRSTRTPFWLVAPALSLLPLTLLAADERPAAAPESTPTADPPGRWQAAAPMNVPREYCGGVLLKDGKVLAVSGHPLDGKSIASAEVYDPESDRWTATGSLNQARNGGDGATLLLDGRVLLAGDHDNSTGALSGAETYDPATGSWARTGSLQRARGVHTTTRLLDGTVLAAGGIDWNGEEVFSSAEIYDPQAGAWRPTGSMISPRFAHRAVLLADGRVLVLGGYEKYPGEGTAAAEIYDPAKGVWRSTSPMRERRSGFAVAALRNGKVLVVGGKQGAAGAIDDRVLASVEVFDPEGEEWAPVRSMAVPRALAAAVPLADGRVLVAGGASTGGVEVASAEIFDPALASWISAGSMATARRNHRAVLLADGSVLFLGGTNGLGGQYLSSAERFTPSAPAAAGPAGDGPRKRRLGVLIFPGFELLDLYGPLEMWGNLRERVEIVVVAAKKGEVPSSQGPKTVAEFGFDDCPRLDLMLVPGGFGAVAALRDATTLDWLRVRAEKAEIVMSVCNGASVLAAAGLLDGKRATTNKAFWQLATAPGPNVEWIPRARWVDAGKFVTSSGVSAGIDMSLAVISRLFGRPVAKALANGTEYEWHEDPAWDPFAELHGLGEVKK
jgi:putative intracellular protease/amidase